MNLNDYPWAERVGVVREALFYVLRSSLKTLDTRTVNERIALRLDIPADKVLSRVVSKLGETHARPTTDSFTLYGREAKRWAWPPMAPEGAKHPATAPEPEVDQWTIAPTSSAPSVDLERVAKIMDAEGITLREYIERYT